MANNPACARIAILQNCEMETTNNPACAGIADKSGQPFTTALQVLFGCGERMRPCRGYQSRNESIKPIERRSISIESTEVTESSKSTSAANP